jgi:hypothetical protein
LGLVVLGLVVLGLAVLGLAVLGLVVLGLAVLGLAVLGLVVLGLAVLGLAVLGLVVLGLEVFLANFDISNTLIVFFNIFFGALADFFIPSDINFLLSIDSRALANITDEINGDIFVPPVILQPVILYYNKYLNTIYIAIIVVIKFINIVNRLI